MSILKKQHPEAVVIGAGREAIHSIKKAREMGLEVLAFDGDSHAEGLKYADYPFVVDIQEREKIGAILDKWNPGVVLPVPVGRYLTTAGFVNDRYSLPGVTEKAASACTDKWEFHKMLAAKSLRKASALLLKTGASGISDKWEDTAYPCILKPRFGSGSRAVSVYRNKEELENGIRALCPLKEDFILETCVEGMEYGVDGAMIDGRFCLILLREKINTPYPYRQCVGYLSVIENAGTYDFICAVKKYLSDIVTVLSVNNCLLHADIIKNREGEPFIIELSARPSGHNLYNRFTPLATGVDEVEEFIRYALPMPGRMYHFEPDRIKQMIIRYFDFSDVRIKRIPDPVQMFKQYPLHDYSCSLFPGNRLGSVMDGASLMHRGYFIMEAGDRETLLGLSEELLNEFEWEKIDGT